MGNDIQKATMLRRIPAWLLDIILVLVLATGLMAGLSYVLDLDAHMMLLRISLYPSAFTFLCWLHS